MKRVLFTLLLTACCVSFCLAQHVSVTISDGISNSSIKAKMEATMSRMLSEINAAQQADRDLNFAEMGISVRVQESMSMLWENTPFMCTDENIVEHCITTRSGYQIRNIPLMMKPTGDGAFNEEDYQEAVISFNRQGEVESFYLTISNNLYMNVIKSNQELTDMRRRQMILDWVERFRTAYNQLDLNFLENIFSDHALIITGTVIQQKSAEGFMTPKVKYYEYTKTEYINKLKGQFGRIRGARERNQHFNFKVTFDSIEVKVSENPDVYGVLLHQGWTNGEYHDDGYLFLLWDFKNEDKPEIHVRTWQPDKINGKPLPKDEIFSLQDFPIE